MAQKILLINPAKRPSKRKTRRTAKQKAATKKLVALNKRRANIGKRAKNPVKKSGAETMAKARRTAAQKAATKKLVSLNKRRARNPISKRKTKKRVYARPSDSRASTAGRILRRRRKNPISRSMFDTTVMPAITGTTGALVTDAAFAYMPVPATIKSGPLRHLAKAATALGLTYVAGMAVSKKTAERMGIGALTVIGHDAAKEALNNYVPGLKMDGMGYYNPGMPVGNDMGLYVESDQTPSFNNNFSADYDEMGLYVQ